MPARPSRRPPINTKPEQLYRALLEATAFGLKRIVETLQQAGVPVRRFVASGGLPNKSPLLMQIYADVLNERIKLAASKESVALGAAILGCLAAGPEASGHASLSQAIHAMAPEREDVMYRPDLAARRRYEKIYALYRSLADGAGVVANVMRGLRDVGGDASPLRETGATEAVVADGDENANGDGDPP